MNRILVAVDGSEPSLRAARRAMSMAPRLGLSVLLVHVLPEKTAFADWEIGGDETELRRLHDERCAARMEKITAALGEPSLETRCLKGTPAEAIAAAARASDVELVAVGSRGRTLLGGVLIGSVAHRLVHICEKPILIVH